MNCTRSLRGSASLHRLLRVATSLVLGLVTGALAFAQGTGAVSGSVTSASTRNALQGAIVSIPALNRSEFTDNAGSFLITNVPAGTVELVISYTGFEDQRRSVTVRAGETQRTDLELKAANAIMMEAFTVATIKEGQALAITEQRNAINLKNVTALDEWGVLPTQNVGELVSRLPGITGWQTDEDDLIMNVSIRGQPFNYTRLNVDGMSSTGVGGDGRTATLHSFSGSMYEQIEIIAGQTPDKRADSLGGQLNLKTRSPLAMAERRRISYSVSARYFPSWSNVNDVTSKRPIRPDVSGTYTEVFDVRGGHKNLAVSLSASYQEVLSPFDSDLMLYENTVNDAAYFNNYLRKSGYNNRFISAFNGRVDYRLSRSTQVSLRFLYNAGSEPFFNYTDVQPRVTTALTVFNPNVANSTGAIMPGYTANRTEIRAAGNSSMFLNPQRYSFTSKNPTGTLVFEHNWGRLKVDHAYRWSNTHWNSGAGRNRENGTLQLRTPDGQIGFILDNSKRFGAVFTQTTGPDVYNPASYASFQTGAANTTTQPVPTTSVIFNKRDTITDTNEVTATVNASYTFATEFPITLKGGLDTINRRVNNRQPYSQRWYGVVGTTLTGTPLMELTEFEREHGGRRLPVFDPTVVATQLGNPAQWYQDVNFTATSQYTNRRILEEGVDSAYIQGQTKLGRLTVLGGVRGEWVSTDTFTFAFRTTRTPIAVEPDHFKRAARDAIAVTRDGDYNRYFPSVHASYDVTSNFKVRGSYSTSYGRPFLAQLIAGATPNDTARTVTMGNPELQPQLAKNYDVKLEYYGATNHFSVGAYRKTIKDYIGSASRSGDIIADGPDNGFEGNYVGYEIVRANNLGNATLRGLEFDFRQRLTFLPGAFKGLAVRGNYTYLQTYGRFSGTVDLKNGQVPGFVPRAANLGLQYSYQKFGASFDVNQTGRYPIGYSLTSPGSGNIYRNKITRMNASVTYRVRPNATAFLYVTNIGEEGTDVYTFTPSRPRQSLIASQTLKFGVSGQF
ncbi:MAG: TonB-dependent receptor [Opitutaceae bacterium]|nr:TonB-dependent receptor [Opitutaceae bacterium]